MGHFEQKTTQVQGTSTSIRDSFKLAKSKRSQVQFDNNKIGNYRLQFYPLVN